ncbi:MAG: hypothetical protein OHK0039_42280 [Bacteroidia bacterium]
MPDRHDDDTAGGELVSLPSWFLPGSLLGQGQFRAFMVQPDSRLPFDAGSYIIGRRVEGPTALRPGQHYVAVTRQGIFFQQLEVGPADTAHLLPSAPERSPLPLSHVRELWEPRLFLSANIP